MTQIFGSYSHGKIGGYRMSNLVVFGDSWAYGDELTEYEKPYGQLIAEHLGYNYFNYARIGSSIPALVLQLKKYINDHPDEDTTAIFFLTDYSRTVAWENEKEINVIASGAPGDKDAVWFDTHLDSDYYKFYHDEFGIFQAENILMALQFICKRYNIKDYYIIGWTKWDIDTIGVDVDKIYMEGKKSCLELFSDEDDPINPPIKKSITQFYNLYNYDKFIAPKACHPNQLGHKTIANALIEWINK